MDNQNRIAEYLKYISLGTEIAGAIAVPVFLGYGLDWYFECSPWLLLAGCAVGMVNFFILIFNINESLKNK
ncbi:MAG TPA: AtpZ/AtpI family protein [Fodinibius sp.]|nr:AtpZ/AtpI family protein [Fodinibius sp.]